MGGQDAAARFSIGSPVHDDRLLRAPPFDTLEPHERQRLLAETTRRFVARGRFVFRRGEPAGRLFVVAEGAVRVGIVTRSGREVALGILGRGDLFGLVSFFDGGPRSTDARALTNTLVGAVPYPSLATMTERSSAFGRSLGVLAAAEIRRLQRVVAELSDGDAVSRLAGVLLDLTDRFGSRSDRGVLIGLRITQQDLADVAGVSRETVSRCLGELSRAGLVVRTAHGYVVTDPAGLQRRHGGGGP